MQLRLLFMRWLEARVWQHWRCLTQSAQLVLSNSKDYEVHDSDSGLRVRLSSRKLFVINTLLS